ncbi:MULTISPECIES: tetratricopeptide repeat protein [unclassified Microcoleus]|uniref:tetratricopeptide repeat protein n=1 Tax=unclassified Microcoleus TaxID=2642155 RepID=UPI002FD42489
MATYLNLSTLAKTTAFAIALLTCQSCLVVPVSVPSPTPVTLEDILNDAIQETPLDIGLGKTCYADALTKSEGEKVTASSDSLETAADKLATAGKHKEAIRKYNEAAAAAMNEAVADGSIENMEIDAFLYKKDETEAFKEEHRPIIQKSAESNFKIGSSYARIGEYEKAIDCFNGTLKVGILPPNDAIAYLNRGDAHERMGARDKAIADFQQAANLFKKHKLPSYEKLAQKRLQAATKK